MRQLDLLHQYQELEILMEGYRRERNSLQIRRELKELQTYLLEQQKKLVELDDEANKKQNALNKIYHEYDNIINNLRIDRERISSGIIRNLKQAEQLEKDANTLKEKAEQKEVELEILIAEVEDFDELLKEIGVRITDAKKKYRKVKSIYDGEAGEIEKKYNIAKDKSDELIEKIDKSLLAKYKRLRGNYEDPLSIVDSNSCCSGCNMQIASLAIQLLKESNSIIECENCGRILYMDEEESQVS